MTNAKQRNSSADVPTTETTQLSSGKAGLYAMQPLAAAVVTALNPGAAVAQEEQSGLEEIIVTATKREMSMQDLGQSITAITTDDIEKQAFQSLEDVMRVLPGVSLANAVPGRNSIIFRGISTGTQEYYTDSQVAVYLDEQPVTTISQQPDIRLIDIARVESLPGPQGTLFGASSQSGTIRYITNKPETGGVSGMVGAEVSQTKGGEMNHDLHGWVNLPIVEDRFAVRAVGYVSHDGGYVDNVLGLTLDGSRDNSDVVEEDYNEWDNIGARVRARWIATENWEFDLSYMVQESGIEGAWETDPAIGDFQHTKFHKEFRDDDWSQTSLTARGDLGFAELTVNASLFERDIVYSWDNMVYEQWKDAYFGVYFGIPLYNSDYTFGTIFNDQQEESTAFELRLQSKAESKLGWMIGGYYEDKTTDWFYGAHNPDYVGTTSWYAAQAYAYYYGVYLGYDIQYPLPPTELGYTQTYSNDIKQTAFFGTIDYDFTDEFRVSIGARWFEYDRVTVKIDEFPAGLPPFGSFDIGGRTVATGDESDTVIKLGASYNLSDDVMLFAHFAEGFRIGGDNSRRAAQTGFVPPEYLADKVENTEIGIKSTLAGGNVRLNLIAFSMDWSDIQISQSNVNGQWWLRGTLNGGRGENQGFELETQWQMTPNLYTYAYASFGDPKYVDEIVRLNDTVPAGTPMVWAYKEKFSAGLEYTIPDLWNGDVWLAYNHSYEGKKWNNLTNAIARDPVGLVPSYTMANAHVGLEMENGWDFQLTVRNVWDEKAVNSLSNDTSGAFFGDPRFDRQQNLSRPRTIGLTVRKHFE